MGQVIWPLLLKKNVYGYKLQFCIFSTLLGKVPSVWKNWPFSTIA
jgi:hypothetical protein